MVSIAVMVPIVTMAPTPAVPCKIVVQTMPDILAVVIVIVLRAMIIVVAPAVDIGGAGQWGGAVRRGEIHLPDGQHHTRGSLRPGH